VGHGGGLNGNESDTNNKLSTSEETIMAAGKKIGEYSLKMITMTLSPGPAGSVLNHVNWEGTATGFGAVFGTATFVGGPKDGTFSWCSTSFLENGDGLTAMGQGTYESTGKNKWHTETHLEISDGRRTSSEGEIDLASRSWKGTIFEG
jgi:hypothetical protein